MRRLGFLFCAFMLPATALAGARVECHDGTGVLVGADEGLISIDDALYRVVAEAIDAQTEGRYDGSLPVLTPDDVCKRIDGDIGYVLPAPYAGPDGPFPTSGSDVPPPPPTDPVGGGRGHSGGRDGVAPQGLPRVVFAFSDRRPAAPVEHGHAADPAPQSAWSADEPAPLPARQALDAGCAAAPVAGDAPTALLLLLGALALGHRRGRSAR
jgi:hypothetical protein